MPKESLVQLDLNNIDFQESWFELEAVEAERVRATLKKLKQMTWDQVYRDSGLKWEKIIHLDRNYLGLDAVYSFRLSRASRGLGFRDGRFLRVLLVSPDHDKTYGKK